MAAATILLVRHGESDWNAERRVQGQTDRPLTETGLSQARALADQLADEPLEAVYASDLSRARDTARAVAEKHTLQVQTLPDLRERDFGSWEGLTEDEALERFPETRNGAWGDAETHDQLAARIVPAIRSIAAQHPRGHVLVVTHGGPLRAMLTHCGIHGTGPIANCHVIRLAFQDGEFTTLD